MNRSTLRSATGSASPDSTRAPSLTDRQIGQQIRQHRLLRRLTQARVAAQMGISYQQLHKYEDGSSRISMGRLSSLAKVLNVPVTRLLSEDDQPEHPLWPAKNAANTACARLWTIASAGGIVAGFCLGPEGQGHVGARALLESIL